MDIKDVIHHRYDGYNSYSVTYTENGDFTLPTVIDQWQWRELLLPKITVTKYKWKCRACQKKILDDVQVVTTESQRPSYHVNCWKLLYERMMHDITRTNEALFSQIEGVELTPCPNAIDVPNEP